MQRKMTERSEKCTKHAQHCHPNGRGSGDRAEARPRRGPAGAGGKTPTARKRPPPIGSEPQELRENPQQDAEEHEVHRKENRGPRHVRPIHDSAMAGQPRCRDRGKRGSDLYSRQAMVVARLWKTFPMYLE